MTQYSGKVIRKTPVTPTQQSASGVWKLNEQAAAIRNNSWPVPGVPDPISRSVRFRSSASAYFSRTPASNGSSTTFTISLWLKRGTLGVAQYFAAARLDANTLTRFSFDSADRLRAEGYVNPAINLDFISANVFRDPSAWYHIVIVADTGQATQANRFKFYVNNQLVTALSVTYPSQNASLGSWNTTQPHNIGAYNGSTLFDGYITEMYNIDGQALTPSSFGTTDTATGAWIPMPYTGTYGTNGFYLNFKDNTSTTTLGYDYSGNANNWTANNISLTSGTTYDSMLDVPTPWVGYTTTTDTSAVTRGNYNTLNYAAPGTGTISNANLTSTSPTTTVYSFAGTMLLTTGKWYWEVTATTINSANQYPFIGAYTTPIPNSLTGAVRPGADSGIGGFSLRQNGNFYYNGSTSGTITTSFTTGDVIGIAFDVDAQSVTYYKNGSSIGTQGSLGAGPWVTAVSEYNGSLSNHNFGQRPFSYSPPSGYKTLCTTNLPTPTIANGASYMAATLYTGNGTSQSINNSVNGVSFRPDFVWYKNRSIVASHNLFDSVRGVNQYLISDSTAAEGTASGVTAFNSNGFSVGSLSNGNGNGNAIVAWQWQAGQGTTSSNTSGSITSTVSVSTTSGFSIVTYTGTGANATVGHGLGVAPNMVIVKERNAVRGWPVYHSGLTSATYYVDLQTTAAQASASTIWNSTAPTSTVFSIGTDTGTNQSTGTYVAYCFAAVAGYSAIGSYTGNGSSDGPFVYLGFRPRFILYKNASFAGTSWAMLDSSRNTYNVENARLFADSSGAEDTSVSPMDFTSNGFKVRSTNDGVNRSGDTIIYAAFAENPFKYSNAR